MKHLQCDAYIKVVARLDSGIKHVTGTSISRLYVVNFALRAEKEAN